MIKFLFQPKEDLTAFELAFVLQHVEFPVGIISFPDERGPPEQVARHFVAVSGTDQVPKSKLS